MKKETKFEKVSLKNVLTPDGEKDLTVEIVPFDRRNDSHVEFAFACADMYGRMPSSFANQSEAARAYVDLFLVHKGDDTTDPNSVYSCVRSDLRACRTLFNTPSFQKALQDFFMNA